MVKRLYQGPLGPNPDSMEPRGSAETNDRNSSRVEDQPADDPSYRHRHDRGLVAKLGGERPPSRFEAILEVEDDPQHSPGRHEEGRDNEQNAESELHVPHARKSRQDAYGA